VQHQENTIYPAYIQSDTNDTILILRIFIKFLASHHHHHHVKEGLGLIPVPCILKMKLVPPSLPRSSYVSSSFGLYCSACLGILFVSILCVCVVATFPGTVLFPLLYSLLLFFP